MGRRPSLLVALIMTALLGPFALPLLASGHADGIERQASSTDLEWRGDEYMRQSRFELAAEHYKIALKRDPGNQALWEKHRRAFNQGRAIQRLIDRARSLSARGEHEEATLALQQAILLSPRDQKLWRLYENSLRGNPNIAVILDDEQAWENFKKGKSQFKEGRLAEARYYFGRVGAATRDPALSYFARRYLERTNKKLSDRYPNIQVKITERPR